MNHFSCRSLLLASVALAVGCASSSGASTADNTPRTGSVGVGQGGAQDIAEFRSILASGAVPEPTTLDPVGFFAEHAIALPAASCGHVVCAQPALAVARRFEGPAWTMAFVALNSAVDPSTLTRPPVHTVIVVERTARTAGLAGSTFDALHHFVAALRPEDRVSLVEVGDTASVLVSSLAPTDAALGDAADRVSMAGTATTAATYDGLALAARELEAPFTGHRHVLLVTSGFADGGVASNDRTLTLASAILETGATLSVVGAGAPYGDTLPIAIGELGGGAYYFAESGADLVSILDLEGRTSLFPIARDFTMRITPAPGYTIGRTYGASRAHSDGTQAILSSPMLLVGQRTGPSDVTNGRRGGGGGFFVELLADPSASGGAGAPAYTVEISYTDTATMMSVSETRTVNNPLSVGALPSGNLPEFSDPSLAKVFMMLNMYLTLKSATQFFADGDCARAMGVIDMVQQTVEWWQASPLADPDVQADWRLINQLRDVVSQQCSAMGPVDPIQPRTGFNGGCFFD
jgi:Ca-activated chloride channel family protein